MSDADLGQAGRAHFDARDQASSLTEMFSTYHLPGNPGFFHLLQHGAYISTNDYKLKAFCGLQNHGSSPPRPLRRRPARRRSPNLAKKASLSFIYYPDERTKERIAMAFARYIRRGLYARDSYARAKFSLPVVMP